MDWSGHDPKPENWQIQYPDGSIVVVEGQSTNFDSHEGAKQQAIRWAEDWQTSLIVKKTS